LAPEYSSRQGVYEKGAHAGATIAGSEATRTGNAMIFAADKSSDYAFD
jgi:hypothetical protein